MADPAGGLLKLGAGADGRNGPKPRAVREINLWRPRPDSNGDLETGSLPRLPVHSDSTPGAKAATPLSIRGGHYSVDL